jgi:TonB family protein
MSCVKPLSLLLAAAALLFTACSKKEKTAAQPATPAPASAPAPAPAAAPTAVASSTADADKDAPSIRFNLPGSSDSGSGVAPAQTPSSPALPSSAPTAPTGGVDQDGVENPQIVEFYPPFYPLSLRMQGIEGRVVLELDINERGDVTKVGIYGSSASQFNEFAIAAAKQWKFNPARKNGTPTAGVYVFPALDFASEFGSRQMSMQSPLAALTYIDGTYYTANKEGRLAPANVTPSPLLRVSPSFDSSKVGGRELKVTIVATVNEEGQVTETTVKDPTGTEFDNLAAKAVRFWQFVPEIKDGKPVTKKVSVPVVLPAASAAK